LASSAELVLGLVLGLVFGLVLGLVFVVFGLVFGLDLSLGGGLGWGLVLGLGGGLGLGLGLGLLETRSVLVTSRTPEEASSRSLIAALTWLISGVVSGLCYMLLAVLVQSNPAAWLGYMWLGVVLGLTWGSGLALRNGAWFVLLQKVAQRRLTRAGNLPPRPYDFLEWGIERQILRRVGGGVRFRHNLIQQHLANTTPDGVS
jgi:hypothetical protein